ncbi:hypothetical protein EVAR_83339_1 [Eumeta japonica]|uniref:Uncharacterized protein n=1 Tax=Eumeta variegata TaxID=151549 RepID=A0A4C1VW88_EUMVA|nr:hypothetical protein EVAR_83339_1 [Eumeta japonica]
MKDKSNRTASLITILEERRRSSEGRRKVQAHAFASTSPAHSRAAYLCIERRFYIKGKPLTGDRRRGLSYGDSRVGPKQCGDRVEVKPAHGTTHVLQWWHTGTPTAILIYAASYISVHIEHSLGAVDKSKEMIYFPASYSYFTGTGPM